MPAENAAMEKSTSCRMDIRQHRHHAPPVEDDGAVDRLVAKSRPVIRIITGTNNRCFWIFLEAGLIEQREGWVNPIRLTGPSGQRAGHRRQGLAVGRAGP